jgi:hypothetical protein
MTEQIHEDARDLFLSGLLFVTAVTLWAFAAGVW